MTATGQAAFDHKPVFRGTAILMLGNIVGQVIALLGLLVLARVYGPASMGLWATFFAYGSFIPFLSGLHYDLGIVIADNERDAVGMVVLALSVAIAFAALFFVGTQGFLFLNESMGWDLFKNPHRWSMLSLGYIPYILGYGFYNAALGWGMRTRRFTWMMATRISVPSVIFIMQYLFQNVHVMENGLVFGTIVTFSILCVWSLWFLRQPITSFLGNKDGTIVRLKNLAFVNHGYPLYAVPRSILFTGLSQLIVLLLGFFYTMQIVGAFNMAYRAMYAPMVLIGTSLGQALLPSLSEIKHSMHKVEDQISVALRFLGWAYLPVLTFIFFYGPQAFTFFFGAKWASSGIFAGYLTMALFGAATTLWLERIFDVMNRQRLHLILAVFLNCGTIVGCMLAHWLTENANVMILTWSASMLLYAVVWLGAVYHICGFQLRRLVYTVAEMSILAIVLYVSVRECVGIEDYNMRVVGFTVLFSVYGAALWLSLHNKIDGYFFQSKKETLSMTEGQI